MALQRVALPDWAFPYEECVPESLLHLRIRTLLFLLAERYLAQQNVRALTGSDQFVYWNEGDTGRRIAPDVYIILDKGPYQDVTSWRVWGHGKPPDFALEIVSSNKNKDYDLAPSLYNEVGVRELVIVDPKDGPNRLRWQVYRRDATHSLVRSVATQDDRVQSEILGCYLRWVHTAEGEPRIRLGIGPQGENLVLTPEEEVERERAAKERERAAKERERAAKERERAAKERERAAKEREQALRLALEARVAALEAQLRAPPQGEE